MVGIEVYYKDYGPEIITGLLKVAKRYNLIPTGGTDYHAFDDGSEVTIGGALTPPQSIERLFALAGKHSVELLEQR